jgi:N-acetylated-alpha-linked acidic dipeptidase
MGGRRSEDIFPAKLQRFAFDEILASYFERRISFACPREYPLSFFQPNLYMHMRKLFASLLFIVICFNATAQQKLMGFKDSAATRQLLLEHQFDASLRNADLDSNMKFLSSRPHHVGSEKGKINAEYIAALFRQAGFETSIETYQVLFPTPKNRLLELLSAKPFKAKLEEPAIAEDHTSNQKTEQLPTYNAYSADGDVTAELGFVNRGVPADYEELERMGIDVKGKIVIAKYGGSWRGIKPKVAAEHGAIGCIIYSDPADDGYTRGDVYPAGPFKNKDGAQRGSVMDMPVYPGDPLTPGIGATASAKRLERKDAITIMKIPVLPISYDDALPFLQSLRGPVVPAGWRGTLPITYHAGPSVDKVHLKLAFNWDIKPVNDVIAKIPGSVYPDEWVLRGNHHDAWVNGASDPLSGLVAELAEAKAIGDLVKNGYRPKRTLVYCAWDGEEPALLGSTEWVEDHAEELKKKAVVYINSDGNGRGFVGAEGSHTLESFFNEVAEDVKDPQTGLSIRDRRYAKTMVDAPGADREKLLGNKRIRLAALGAGSDYSPFIQHLGISSIDVGFGGENEGGEYHSIYDSYDNYIRFKDPGFNYGIALAKTAGRLTLRMAEADVLPFEFSSFYKVISEYAADVKTVLDKMRSSVEVQNKMVADNLFDAAKDPTKPYSSPKAKEPVPYLNFSSLENALAALKTATESFEKLVPNANALPVERQQQLNAVLFNAERSLMLAKGLPRREWYRHSIYAPGYYTGYGVKTLPGIREGIEEKHWEEAQQNIELAAVTLNGYTADVNKAIEILK